MSALDRWVLDEALTWAAPRWRADRLLRVAVNLSATNLHDASLPEHVAALLRSRGLPARVLVLEITETVAMTESAEGRLLLQRLAAMGVELSIDDFGTGWSSLNYLRGGEFSEVKLDRSFVAEIVADPRAEAIVASTIRLAHQLGARVVAEGVEDERTLRVLTEMGCDVSQGYWHSRPLPGEQFDRWCEQGRAASPGADWSVKFRYLGDLTRRP